MDLSFLEQIPYFNQLPQGVQRILFGIGFVVVLLIAFSLLRGLITRLVMAPLRSAAKNSKTTIDDTLVDAVNGAVTFVILALTIFVSTALLPYESHFEAFLFRVALTLLVIGIVRFFYSLGGRVARFPELLDKLSPGKIIPSFEPLIRYVIRFIVIAIGLLITAEIWNINAAGLITGLGLGGLAVSLAAKNVMDDFLGFLVITYDNLFVVDEYIASEHGEGIIEQIGLRSTAIRQLNQGLVYVPNGEIANASLTNWSRLGKRWFNFKLNIAFETTPKQVESLVSQITDMLTSREKVQEGSVVVLFTEYADYALSILVRCYVEITDWTKAHEERHAVNLEIMRIVADMGLSVALPSRSLYLEEVPEDFPGAGRKQAEQRRDHKRQTIRAGSEATSFFQKGSDGTEIQANEQDGQNSDQSE